MIIAIIIFLYIVYKINQAATRDLSNSSAGRWAADVCRVYEQDAINYNRKHIGITERYMSANEWDKIKYPKVPSRAMMIYRNAFRKHDGDRFDDFILKVLKGEEKINSGTLYPYDIVEKYLYRREDIDDTLEAQWRQLPDYVEKGRNILVVADVSGSMTGRPMASSIGLALYFA